MPFFFSSSLSLKKLEIKESPIRSFGGEDVSKTKLS